MQVNCSRKGEGQRQSKNVKGHAKGENSAREGGLG